MVPPERRVERASIFLAEEGCDGKPPAEGGILPAEGGCDGILPAGEGCDENLLAEDGCDEILPVENCEVILLAGDGCDDILPAELDTDFS